MPSGIILADEMGLGKSPQSVCVANCFADIRRVLIICPASLKLNWRREWQRWDVKNLTAQVIEGTKPTALTGDVVIVNYDVLNAHRGILRGTEWDLLICDEAHYLKNKKTDRTLEVLGGIKRNKQKEIIDRVGPIPAKRRLFLTGTPIVNRPKELWPLVVAADPDGLGSNWFHYATRYCAGQPIVIGGQKKGFWWDGAAHLDELQEIMRSRFMIRRLKKDVLKELPAKRRQVIIIEPNPRLAKLVAKEKAEYESYAGSIEPDLSVSTPAFEHISEIRRQIAVKKVPFVAEHVREILEEQNKVVVFCHHHDVTDALAAEFGSVAVVLDGRMNAEDRQKAVDRFQTDASVRVFIGSIQAAGVGITLTAASTVVFAELDWVPGNLSQAEDRLHRIGQKESVLVHHVVLENSLDQQMTEVLIKKQEVIDKALDKEKT